MHVSYKSFRGDKSDGFGTSILLGAGGGVGAGGAAQYVVTPPLEKLEHRLLNTWYSPLSTIFLLTHVASAQK